MRFNLLVMLVSSVIEFGIFSLQLVYFLYTDQIYQKLRKCWFKKL